jgi:CHAT domain-containing protein/TPR repeat protein
MRILLVLGLFLCCSPSLASEYVPPTALVRALETSDCKDVFKGSNDLDYVRMYSPWNPSGVDQLVSSWKSVTRQLPTRRGEPKPSVATLLANDWQYSHADDRLHKVTINWLTQIEATILRDVGRQTRAVCDIFRAQQSINTSVFFGDRKALTGFEQPYARLGRRILDASSCVMTGNGRGSSQTLQSLLRQFSRLPPPGGIDPSPDWFLELYSRDLTSSCTFADTRSASATGVIVPVSVVGEVLAAADCAVFQNALARYSKAIGQLGEHPMALNVTNRLIDATFVRWTSCFQTNSSEFFGPVASMLFERSAPLSSIHALPDGLKLTLAQAAFHPANDGAKFSAQAVRLLIEVANSNRPFKQDNDGEPHEEDAPAVRASTLLAWVYETGIGAPKNQSEAEKWSIASFTKASPSFPWGSNPPDPQGRQVPASAQIDDLADWLIQRVHAARTPAPTSSEEPEPDLTEELIKLSSPLTMDNFPDLSELTRLYAHYDSVRTLVQKETSGIGKFAIATMLLEGQSEAGKLPALAATLLNQATEDGESAAAVRLAQLYEIGWGVSKDIERAVALYAKAAKGGQPLGNFSLARLYDDGTLVEQDLGKAEANYRAGLQPLLVKSPKPKPNAEKDNDPIGDEWFTEHSDTPSATRSEYRLFSAVQSQVVRRTAFFTSPAGDKLLQDLVKNKPVIAVHLGRLFLCADCGYAVNLQEAARWFRLGVEHQSMYSAYLLARFLLLNPEYETNSSKAIALLQMVAESTGSRSIEAELLLSSLQVHLGPSVDQEKLKERINGFCKEVEDSYTLDCITLAHRLAIGAVSNQFVSVGHDILIFWSGRRDEKAKAIRDDARAALVDVYSLYGDFSSAAELARPNDINIYLSDFKARQQTFSQLISSLADGKDKSLSADLVTLLEILQGKGDSEAAAFRDLEALGRPVSISSSAGDLATLTSAFETQLARNGPSLGMVASSRALSAIYVQNGQNAKALAYELVALNTQADLAKASSVEFGPLPYRLVAACQLARSSRRVLDLGYRDVSTVLAKEAVNRLQEVRTSLVGLPLRLRNCFAELTQDQYRKLVTQFIDQGLVNEANAVNDMLKDVEEYEYVSLDPGYVHRAFDKLPFFSVEQTVLERAFAVKPAGGPLSDRFSWLQKRRASKRATSVELIELRTLEEELKRRQTAFTSTVDDLITAVDALPDKIRRTSESERLENQVQNDAEQRAILQEISEGKAASLLFVVLADRMDAILTTKNGPFTYSWKTIDDAPFSELVLNRKINAFRSAIDRRSSDTDELARELYNILFERSSFAAELRAANVDLLYLSLDRGLRNLPFSALKSTRGYLVNQYSLALSTGVRGRAQDPSRTTAVAAFGTTKAIDGFPPLINAGKEMSAIVKVDGGTAEGGVYAGTIKLNEDFTLTALQDAFVQLPGDQSNKVVHIASHFKLAGTDATSFLLLGDGKHLTIDAIRKNSAVYDFRYVDLLTLSACSTAYSPTTDSEPSPVLQSFAALTQKKGARAILATLWPVVDSSTARFMETFYSLQDKEKVPHAVALAMTQRAFISSDTRSLSDPFFWSGFVMLTNSR